ncbi:HIRAN domain-containing protein [Pseudarthrobacter sp. NamB4]|uniref:HIRAN domain-containing protein n=1 Tax=Pseudarthrobacter sp. NamB4 TaxID=2576837 RepID=UPI0010FF1625|nr:HIRAN domain-containing protein [Pseudarthrobacter sp. NamB4]TLM72424.1 hypothetical protein FDW81_12915 [Pseudarthrobacter sp. NamB4]
MGMMKKLTGWLKGVDQDIDAPKRREDEPAVAVTQPPREAVAVNAPVTSPEPQAPPLAPSVTAEEAAAEPERELTPKAASIKKVTLDDTKVFILDLRELPSSRFRIVGSAFWVSDAGRYKHGGNEYLLVREPKNEWDANAVAVYGKGRKIGHLSEAKAAALSPIFDELGFGAYRVSGTAPAPNSIRMWVDLPAIPKLRSFAKTVGKAE